MEITQGVCFVSVMSHAEMTELLNCFNMFHK